MDTSEMYIRMCDCEEIQGVRSVYMISGYGDFCFPNERGEIIWLPRQDQLQGVLIKKGRWFDLQISGGGHAQLTLFMDDGRIKFISDTAEQALIQGVMHELHRKRWDGERWTG